MIPQEINIEAEIRKIEYYPQLCRSLKVFPWEEVRSGVAFRNSAFLLSFEGENFAISQWRTSKRTRTYPYARVYDTMSSQNRVTIIPFVTDEGLDGDHDFLQWDTISLMSLLGVYVIPAYYRTAVKSTRYINKITKQSFDYEYLSERMQALVHYNQSDAYHWNVNEIQNFLPAVAQRAKLYYGQISRNTGVTLHDNRGMDTRIQEILEDINNFQLRSRKLARTAQERERVTSQPKERLRGLKATLTMKNFIGGYYYWTVDEVVIKTDRMILVEKKHSSRTKLPSLADIKDACLKMILFTNLEKVVFSGKTYIPVPAVGLTSDLLQGYCHSKMTEDETEAFFSSNGLKPRTKDLLRNVLREGQLNRFDVFIGSPRVGVEELVGKDS